jgi:hypothetical protein
MTPRILKKRRTNNNRTDNVYEATDSGVDHAKLGNAGTSTSATTGQTAHTNDPVPPNQHHSTIPPWLKKVSWNAPKLLLELMSQASAFPPLQTVAALLLNLVNRYEVRDI